MKLLLKRLMSYFPCPLPVGMSQFETWSDSIIALSGPYADSDSMKFAIASMIMHLGAQRSYVPKNFFVRSLRKTAANQIAGQVFQNIKQKQAEEATKVQQPAEDTAPPSQLSDATPKAQA